MPYCCMFTWSTTKSTKVEQVVAEKLNLTNNSIFFNLKEEKDSIIFNKYHGVNDDNLIFLFKNNRFVLLNI